MLLTVSHFFDSKLCTKNEARKQLTCPPIDPDTSMQNITMEFSSP